MSNVITADPRWFDAIAGREDDGTMTYLWGGPSQKGARLGDAGKPVRAFEFERIPDDERFEKGSPFFMLLFGRPHLCVARSSTSMYARGGHIHPLYDGPKYRILREISKE